MKYHFRDFFLPTQRNGNSPLSLSNGAFLIYFLIASFLVVSPSYLKRLQLAVISSPLSFGADEVIELVNKERVSEEMDALKRNAELDGIAAKKVDDMFEKNYFAHISPEKKTPWDFFKEGQYRYTAAGENLAIDFLTPGDANKAFMESPTHKANILNKLYKEVGAAVVEGTFDGRPTIIIAQYFGTPRVPSRIAKKPETVSVVTQTKEEPVPVKVAGVPEETSKTENATPKTDADKSVLGAATEVKKSDVLKDTLVNTNTFLGSKARVALIAYILIALILISLFLVYSRTGALPLNIVFMGIVILTLLIYATIGTSETAVVPQVTPSSFSSTNVLAF